MIITEIQKKEIESLIPEHGDALVAYGADMYRQGIITGAVILAVGVGCGFLFESARIIYKHRKSQKKKKRRSPSKGSFFLRHFYSFSYENR